MKPLDEETTWHPVLIDGKYFFADAYSSLAQGLEELVPKKLHKNLDVILSTFLRDSFGCDVSDRYVEKE